jgi:hypothetical protein
VDVYPLDCANLRHRRPHQTPPVGLSPVAAVCDRRRPQGRHTAPSAPLRLRVNPSAILDRITGFAESKRSGERLPQAARRASKASQLTGVFRQN